MSSTTDHPDMFTSTIVSLLLRNLGFETSCGLFQIIFSYLDPPKHYERFLLRRLCRTFRRVLKATLPPGTFTTFPRPNYPKLNELMDALNRVYEEDPTKAPKIVFIMKGAGRNKTFLDGYTVRIGGTKEEGKKVVVQDMTSSGAGCGLYANNGLSFLCKDMTFTQCGNSGVVAVNTEGRLINCVITQCEGSGIDCRENALIELEGDQTKGDGNGTWGDSYYYGLRTDDTSSIIHLLFPLTQESVSTNNHNGQNCGGDGLIAIVDNDGNTIEIINEVNEESEESGGDY